MCTQRAKMTEKIALYTLKLDNEVLFLKRSIYGLYNKSAPFFGDLIFFPETKNNYQFYILKLFFSSYDNRFSCPVTSVLHILPQNGSILFKMRKNRCFWPNRCLFLLS